MRYMSRVADELLRFRLQAKGAVLIEGPKWCGKTTTAKAMAASVLALDQPDRVRQYRSLAETAPSLLLAGDVPRLIDEWQVAPNLWSAVRYEVDNRGEPGQFILTGSAVPHDLAPDAHSGIGRISRLKMRPMSLFESGESDGSVSLSAVFDQEAPSALNQVELPDIAFLAARGGWPQAVKMENRDIALFQARDYAEAVTALDISRVDQVRRDREKAERLLRSYARHCATSATLETIRKDIIANADDSFDAKTLYSYIDALKKIFVIDDVPAWNPNMRSRAAIRTADTRFFVDPSIAVAALGLGPRDLLQDLNLFGLVFENLAIRDLRIYADLLSGKVYHYRDKSGLECDAVIHLPNGSYGLVEVKLGGDTLIEQGARTLQDLASRIDTDKMKKPAFLMVLCAAAPYAYRRPDGVLVVPISSLGP